MPAKRPFTGGASDLPLDVPGNSHLRSHFTNMKIVDEDGVPSYDGPDRFTPDAGPIASVVQQEAFEGVVNWIIGYDASSCATVETSADGLAVTVAIG